jgi:hypothetical protein
MLNATGFILTAKDGGFIVPLLPADKNKSQA